MKWIHLCAAALLCTAASAQSLTGTWTGPATTADNGLEMKIALTQEGGKITGYVLSPRSTDTIVDGKVEGANVTLEAERPGRNGTQKVTYTAVLEGDKLKVTMPMFGGRGPGRGAPGRGAGGPPAGMPPRPPQVFELSRTSTAAPAPLPPAPAPITLPMPAPVRSNGLAKTPPMGWNSWNKFRNQVSDKMVREIADAMVRTGMRDAGYIYVNIDDTWEAADRDAQGNIQTNNKFPDMKALSDYVHSKGLKLGIYSSPGPRTCAGYRRQLPARGAGRQDVRRVGHRLPEVRLVQRAQVYDNTQATMAAAYAKMGQALLDSGRPIVYSLCQYGNARRRRMGRAGGRQPVAHHRRHQRPLGNPCSTSGSTCSPAARNTPVPATGTTPTCSRSATAA